MLFGVQSGEGNSPRTLIQTCLRTLQKQLHVLGTGMFVLTACRAFAENAWLCVIEE